MLGAKLGKYRSRSAISKIKLKKFPSVLNDEHKIWSPNYQNTTESDKIPRSTIHHQARVLSNIKNKLIICLMIISR